MSAISLTSEELHEKVYSVVLSGMLNPATVHMINPAGRLLPSSVGSMLTFTRNCSFNQVEKRLSAEPVFGVLLYLAADPVGPGF